MNDWPRRIFHPTRLYITRREIFESLDRWSSVEERRWIAVVLGPFTKLPLETQRVPVHRLYPLRHDGNFALDRWIADEGGWSAFCSKTFTIQLIRDDLGAVPSTDRRFPVDKVGYYGTPQIKLRPEPAERMWRSVEIEQNFWQDWETRNMDPRWPAYRAAFCKIRRQLRSRATCYTRGSLPEAVGISVRNASLEFLRLAEIRPGFGYLIFEEAPLNPGLSLYDVEGILKPEDFLE